ncbi:MAG: MarR family transcriptional regulator [Pelagibacterium sp.]|jgi:DNA-binding MarR family transcriptional regulator|uniref:MarR family winged helix-turn-helix transcriptional regulator n=1 Tax=Pelagibacterium sp. TaxID=1967288 RepID=UPI0032F08AF0|tara:strand:- start:70396 stop:70845 length:450 start_codon:yes stop_codon:yes gene_type:complete
MSHPRPDQELVLENFLPYRLNRAAEAISQEFSRLYRHQYDLTRPEWRCLATVGQYRTVTATAVARHSAMHKTKVSRAVAALEKRRWLLRTEDEGDRRIEHLRLTASGLAAYNELSAVAQAYQERLLKELRGGGADLQKGLAAIELRLKT